eukprot:scaffold148712_cov15-Tisochrysis_lutea.AAC.1
MLPFPFLSCDPQFKISVLGQQELSGMKDPKEYNDSFFGAVWGRVQRDGSGGGAQHCSKPCSRFFLEPPDFAPQVCYLPTGCQIKAWRRMGFHAQ